MSGIPGSPGRSILATLIVSCLFAPPVEAGQGRKAIRRGPRPAIQVQSPVAVPVAVPTGRVVAPAPSPAPSRLAPLGTFRETPYIWVRGNGPVGGGGYSPLNEFGESTMVMYGPISSLRATSAPVMTYTRGYDGQVVARPGTSFSNPNLPSLSPIVYPTQANDFYGFRNSGVPPWWQNGMNWLDQN